MCVCERERERERERRESVRVCVHTQVGTCLLRSGDVQVQPDGRCVLWKGEDWEVIEDSFGVDGIKALFAGGSFRRSAL